MGRLLFLDKVVRLPLRSKPLPLAWQWQSVRRVTSPSRRSREPWTEDESKALIQGKREGKTLDSIAVELGRTPMSVSNRFYHHLFTGAVGTELAVLGPISPENDSKIVALRKEGKQWRGIGSMLSLPWQTCLRRYNRVVSQNYSPGRGYTALHHKRYKEDDVRQLVHLRETERLSYAAISMRMNRSRASLQSRYKRWLEQCARTKSGTRRPWSSSEDAKLAQLKNVERLSLKEIAEHLPGRSLGAVESRHTTLKPHVKPRRIVTTQDIRDTIVRLRETEGLRWKQVAERMPGRSTKVLSAIYVAARRASP